jgi:4a-hydroxytetrahydrobiopterin dehydratase
LSELSCRACRGDQAAIEGERLCDYGAQVPEWDVVDERRLTRTFRFPDFAEALAFVNRVGELAEAEGHHPGIFLTWGEVTIEIWTHKIDALTESDFILAAKIDRL